jgi:hypothetical protein
MPRFQGRPRNVGTHACLHSPMPKKARTRARSALPSHPNQLRREHLSTLELEALKVVSEGVCVPIDQLACILGCGPRKANSLVSRLEQLGCVISDQFLTGESPWLWLNKTGARLSGTGLPSKGFAPAVRGLAHRRAVHEVRLSLESAHPIGTWICESRLYSQVRNGDAEQVPDGVFEIGGERHAIEVELSPKPVPHLERVVTEHSERYDLVIYYVGPRTRRQLRRFKDSGNWPRLLVHDLPGQMVQEKCRPRPPGREPEPWEVDILRLVSEQGAIPIDQLARFMQCGEAEMRKIVDEFARQNYANSASLIASEPDWVWLKEAGNRLSGTTLNCLKPKIGGLPILRTLNELRLQLQSEGEWLSRRRLVREFGPYASVPDAVLNREASRAAILVRFDNRQFDRFASRLQRYAQTFDSVTCFCASQVVSRRLEGLRKSTDSNWLAIEKLPQ